MTDKHATGCSKAAYLGVNYYVCEVQNVHTTDVSVSLLKLPFFACTGKFIKVRAFEIGEPLKTMGLINK